MLVQGAPLFLVLGAAGIAAAIAVFRASAGWKGKNKEELDREVEKYTK